MRWKASIATSRGAQKMAGGEMAKGGHERVGGTAAIRAPDASCTCAAVAVLTRFPGFPGLAARPAAAGSGIIGCDDEAADPPRERAWSLAQSAGDKLTVPMWSAIWGLPRWPPGAWTAPASAGGVGAAAPGDRVCPWRRRGGARAGRTGRP